MKIRALYHQCGYDELAFSRFFSLYSFIYYACVSLSIYRRHITVGVFFFGSLQKVHILLRLTVSFYFVASLTYITMIKIKHDKWQREITLVHCSSSIFVAAATTTTTSSSFCSIRSLSICSALISFGLTLCDVLYSFPPIIIYYYYCTERGIFAFNMCSNFHMMKMVQVMGDGSFSLSLMLQ